MTPAVMRYSFSPTSPLPVNIHTTVMKMPEIASAPDLSVFAIPAALFVSAGSFETNDNIPCDGISASVIDTFQTTRMNAI